MHIGSLCYIYNIEHKCPPAPSPHWYFAVFSIHISSFTRTVTSLRYLSLLHYISKQCFWKPIVGLPRYHIEINHRDAVTVICNYISENKGQSGYLSLTLSYQMKREASPEVIHPTVTWGWIQLHMLWHLMTSNAWSIPNICTKLRETAEIIKGSHTLLSAGRQPGYPVTSQMR